MKLDKKSFSMVAVITTAACTATSYMNYGLSTKAVVASVVSVLISIPLVYLILLGFSKLKHTVK